jgi:hypothetical protein
MGRALINKTKLLAEENQEMATQLREGPAAAQVRSRTTTCGSKVAAVARKLPGALNTCYMLQLRVTQQVQQRSTA